MMTDLASDSDQEIETCEWWRLARTQFLIGKHLRGKGVPLGAGQGRWALGNSPLGGRGLFATCNIEPNQLVFIDAPLILGPRASLLAKPVCVACHRQLDLDQAVACPKRCGLPLCHESCATLKNHQSECETLRSWRSSTGQSLETTATWSAALLRALTPLRSLYLNTLEKELLQMMHWHNDPKHGFEVELIRKLFPDGGPSEEELQFMRRACGVLDANAFETVAWNAEEGGGAQSQSLRGLFPLSGMLNHACSSNTRHTFTQDGRFMVVETTCRVLQGQELLNSYSPLLWSTPARRHLLAQTKHFLCKCPRCYDPTEFGTNLAALYCASEGCHGNILPSNPLVSDSKWECNICKLKMPGRQAALIQASVSRLMSGLRKPNDLIAAMKKVQALIPETNHMAVELQSTIIWMFGHASEAQWKDLSEEELLLKEEICYKLLALVSQLQGGECRMRGLFLNELALTKEERARRITDSNKLSNEVIILRQKALSILTFPFDKYIKTNSIGSMEIK